MAEVEIPNPDELHERGETTFGRRAALTTAIYAVALSIASLGGNNTVKEMLLAQQQSSDQWAFYQAKVIREHQYQDRKSTRLNSSHSQISYAVFCLKKKKKNKHTYSSTSTPPP